ncbi:hypothetical protein ACTXT7_009325 [Hymenolepis weldensis]
MAKHSTSFVEKFRKELNENKGDELVAMSKRKQHCHLSVDSLRTPEFVRRVHEMGLGVNADTDAYVETLRTIVVNPPWIDSVASEGRPYFSQQDSAPSHEAYKIQDWMHSRELS